MNQKQIAGEINQKYEAGASKLRSMKKQMLELSAFMKREDVPASHVPKEFAELSAWCETMAETIEARAVEFEKGNATRLQAMYEHGRRIHDAIRDGRSY